MTHLPDPGAKSSGNAFERALRALVRFVVAVCLIVYMVIDEVLTRLLWPAISRLSRLPVFRWIGGAIAGLPSYAVLVLLAIPFVIIEPVKVVALYWIASGHFVQGPVLLVLAYVVSILSCDRIYHAGHDKLMQIGWFKKLMDWVFALRARGIAWVKSTDIWKAATAFVANIRQRLVSFFG